MSKIELKDSLLHKFLTMCNIKGDMEIKELLLTFKPTEITTRAFSPNKALSYNATLRGKFEDWGEIGISDLPTLKNFINSLANKTFSLKKAENKLICESTNTKLSSTTCNTKYISNYPEVPKYEALVKRAIGNEFVLKSDIIKQIVSNFSTITASSLILSGSGKLITVKVVNEKNELTMDFVIQEEVKEFNVKIAKMFIELLEGLTEYDIKFSINNGEPILYLKVDSKEINFEYIIGTLSK